MQKAKQTKMNLKVLEKKKACSLVERRPFIHVTDTAAFNAFLLTLTATQDALVRARDMK